MKVVHCKHERYSVYIGRPSSFGNPFVIGKDGSRDEVIEKFAAWIRQQPKLLEKIQQLKAEDVLGCWCKPQSCHGDVIVKIWEEMQK